MKRGTAKAIRSLHALSTALDFAGAIAPEPARWLPRVLGQALDWTAEQLGERDGISDQDREELEAILVATLRRDPRSTPESDAVIAAGVAMAAQRLAQRQG